MIFTTLNGSKKRLPKPKNYILQWDKPSRSKRQYTVKQFLKKYWENDFVFEEFPMVGTRLSFDFYNSTENHIKTEIHFLNPTTLVKANLNNLVKIHTYHNDHEGILL